MTQPLHHDCPPPAQAAVLRWARLGDPTQAAPDGHVISMRGPGNARTPGTSQALCQCGWEHETPWGQFGDQDTAIYAHWAAFTPSASSQNTNPQHCCMEQTPTDKLSVHPLLRHMPEWEHDDPRMLALMDDIIARGIDVPIIIDAHNRILDGRHRWRAAFKANIPTVPTQTRAEDDAAGIILGTILQRRHYAKSALAFMAYPLLEKGLNEARARQAKNLKQGKNPNVSPSTIESSTGNAKRVTDFAIELGVSHDLVIQAGKVHAIFTESPDYAALVTDDLLEGKIGLGGIIAGYGGWQATAGKPRPEPQFEHLWLRSIRSLTIRTGRIADIGALRPQVRHLVDQIDDPEHLHNLELFGKHLATDAATRRSALNPA
jgi:hypothetical protein